jgi:delta 1-pyrroline-5-carboxylate dehydrogenase
MLVDSTALPEQAVRDISPRPSSRRASAVRRCAAFMCRRMWPESVTEMLFGAMDELRWATPGRLRPTSAR